MFLLGKFLERAIKVGRLIVTDHDGTEHAFGPGAGEYPREQGGSPGPIRIRLTHPKAANHIVRYPQLGAGEAYMWGWLEVEPPHDIRDMVLFVTMNAKRLGDASRVGFSPRKAKHSLYIMACGDDGEEAAFAPLLARLGKHARGKACLYVNKLADIDLGVLEEMIALGWRRSLERWPD